ncbi:MAG: glycosyltransferase [Planctomycetes bacterium]|nr:glycosyltransferase [Planctomycetota bacterium]
MPVYNRAACIDEAVASVAAQTRADWELWIVDDGSTDGSAERIDRWARRDGRIHALHQAHAGPGAARNAGVRRGRAEWLAFLDSEDTYFPDAVDRFATFLDAHPDVSFVYGYRYRMDADGAVTYLTGTFQDRPTDGADLFGGMFLWHPCVCYHRWLFDAVGGYDERLRCWEDYDLYLRISRHTTFHPLGAATGLRRAPARLARRNGAGRRAEAHILRRYLRGLTGADRPDPRRVNRRLAQVYYRGGRDCFRAGRFDRARRLLAISQHYAPALRTGALAVASQLLR